MPLRQASPDQTRMEAILERVMSFVEGMFDIPALVVDSEIAFPRRSRHPSTYPSLALASKR